MPLHRTETVYADQALEQQLSMLYVPYTYGFMTAVYTKRPNHKIRGLVDTGSLEDPSLRVAGKRGRYLFDVGRFACSLKPAEGGGYDVFTRYVTLDGDLYVDGYDYAGYSALALPEPTSLSPDEVFDIFYPVDADSGMTPLSPQTHGRIGYDARDQTGVDLAQAMTAEVSSVIARTSVASRIAGLMHVGATD
ncbi:MAG: hypothetical protein JWM81_968 [Candidatus Saccharibacteria bacterium]|nr:hypothetical protein [Candidatus Saccharibacteria bacterium]